MAWVIKRGKDWARVVSAVLFGALRLLAALVVRGWACSGPPIWSQTVLSPLAPAKGE